MIIWAFVQETKQLEAGLEVGGFGPLNLIELSPMDPCYISCDEVLSSLHEEGGTADK
jgi:hypothetical protein